VPNSHETTDETTISRADQLRLMANFEADGKLYLVRCAACEPKYGRENWAVAVATGTCAWCGWHE